ncbi:hypothetical protein RS130_09295 [Paraglaciecola aquimarina]|uniref:Uncharacterized protein n=1 Tax=Paraglaciecola aquimarina TaxID=1235557 RepID=A0ABU3SVQ4_9ALTE|nr:hypothetical protein [Paraglaciecola aquimarina]MDU0354103.1 hypothetical protein [Paraglaciecola aquimarina]
MLTNTQFALDQLAYLQANSESKVMQNIAFTEQNVADLVEFLHALTDPCVKDRECLAPWISSASEVDPDGMRLNAIDEFGTEL